MTDDETDLPEKGNRYALAALKRKRTQLAGEVLALRKKIEAREQQLRAVDATIQVFDPSVDPDTLPVGRPQKHVNLFRAGELSRLVLDSLREAGEAVSAAEVTRRVVAKLEQGEEARSVMLKRVRGNLVYHQKSTRLVVKRGQGREARWALA